MNLKDTPADVVIIGAGAAGLMCAARAGRRGLRVVLIDHAQHLAEKIRISGGGRCNFTNLHTSPGNFLSSNPDFCRSALAGYRPADFLDLLKSHGIGWHEKHKGQLFCDERSEAIIHMLDSECQRAHVLRWQPCQIETVLARHPGFEVRTDRGSVIAAQLVVATGGLSVPKIGASGLGYRLARQWGHAVVTPRPGLVPLTFDTAAWQPYAELSGVGLPCRTSCRPAKINEGRVRRATPSEITFDDDVLFTHKGLSGPAILQISSYWQPAQPIHLDLLPDLDLAAALLRAKSDARKVGNVLSDWFPARLAQTWLQTVPNLPAAWRLSPLGQWKDQQVVGLAHSLKHWDVTPTGTQGWNKAEVTVGGVDTRELDSKTMASRRLAGLYFIGEVVDVTGWLGGYNFQWAWASAAACARALTAA